MKNVLINVCLKECVKLEMKHVKTNIWFFVGILFILFLVLIFINGKLESNEDFVTKRVGLEPIMRYSLKPQYL